MQNVRRIRIWYSKLDRAKYISHLDLVRFMLRALRRTAIPVWFSQGYNPRPYVTFALPLSLGVESLRESMEIRIDENIEKMTDEVIMERLSDAMPEGMKILEITNPQMKPSAIAYGLYDITIETKRPEYLARELEKTFASDEITAMKMGKLRGKKVLREINLQDLIKETIIEVKDEKVLIHSILSAGAQKNLSPILLCDTVLEPLQDDVEMVRILRTNLVTNALEAYV